MATVKSRTIRFHDYGDPRKVLQLDTLDVPTTLEPTQVLVRLLAAPINPLDVNMTQGAYVLRRELPAIAGAEGVGEVLKIGSNVRTLSVGQRVISLAATETWREYAVAEASDFFPIRRSIDIISAATLSINPPTAYAMLTEYERLETGDWIVQNSANSGVGRTLIQIARALSLRTINVVRDRDDAASLKAELRSLGADHVFTEREFASEGRRLVASLARPPRLACNGVGGRSALAISAALGANATCVTYGGMSQKAHEFSTGAIVFKNLKVVGHSNLTWLNEPLNCEKRDRIFEHLQDMIESGALKPTPVTMHNLGDFATAIDRHMSGKGGKQFLLIANDASKL